MRCESEAHCGCDRPGPTGAPGKDESTCFVVMATQPLRRFLFKAASVDEVHEWIADIREVIQQLLLTAPVPQASVHTVEQRPVAALRCAALHCAASS